MHCIPKHIFATSVFAFCCSYTRRQTYQEYATKNQMLQDFRSHPNQAYIVLYVSDHQRFLELSNQKAKIHDFKKKKNL